MKFLCSDRLLVPERVFPLVNFQVRPVRRSSLYLTFVNQACWVKMAG